MLLQIAIENHRSIADKQVISFLAVPGEAHPEGQTVEVDGIGRVLRSIVLYGANASGKSAVVSAIALFRGLLQLGVRPGQTIPVEPFRLDPSWRTAPTRIEVELLVGGVQYGYGIAFTATEIVEEWLVRGNDEDTLFERRQGPEGQPEVTFGPALDRSAKPLGFFDVTAAGTRAEQPLLTEMRERNVAEVAEIWKALGLDILVTPSGEPPTRPLTQATYATFRREFLAELLRAADTGVSDVRPVSPRPEIDRVLRTDPPATYQALKELCGEEFGLIQAEFLHESPDGPQAFRREELSDGTQRITHFAFPLDHPEFVFIVIDELDRSLHTQLTRFLLDRLNRSEGTKQALVTVHDTNLLDAQVFGRDAIWFVQKDTRGATQLYSLAEFDKDQLDALTGRIEEGYLQGRFGAVPFLADPRRLGWAAGE